MITCHLVALGPLAVRPHAQFASDRTKLASQTPDQMPGFWRLDFEGLYRFFARALARSRR